MLRENSSSGSNSSSSQNYLNQDSKLNQDSRDSSSCNGFPQKIFSDSNRGARLTNECTDKFNLFEAILVSILQFFCFSYANILHASFLPYNRLLHFSFPFLHFFILAKIHHFCCKTTILFRHLLLLLLFYFFLSLASRALSASYDARRLLLNGHDKAIKKQ